MRFLFAALLASQALTAQLVIPPGLSAYEGFATDGDVWTYRSFRATNRYPASWIGNPRVINQIAWRAVATYAYDFDQYAPYYANQRNRRVSRVSPMPTHWH